MSFLEIKNLVKNFGTTQILKGLNLELEEGGFLVLVGPSGCGKSTLLNSIAGLETITSGEISMKGKAIQDLHPSQRDIAMVFQSYALYPTMNVAQNIGFALEMRGVPKTEREAAIAKVAKTLQIEHLLTRKPAALSGGQRQRVAMGRALVRNPQLFLFDEPLSNLDAKLRVDMRLEIKRLHATTGTTIVYVTHDQIEAMTLATKIAVLKEGEIQQIGTPHEIYNTPANLFVADFMGSPAMNRLEGEIKNNVFHCGQLKLELATKYKEGKVIMGLRPEAINKEKGVSFKATIEIVEPTGSDIFVVFSLNHHPLTARLDAEHKVKTGDSLDLKFNMDKALFFDAETGLSL
jgi:multiple sugar transport system ATP-binding protein